MEFKWQFSLSIILQWIFQIWWIYSIVIYYQLCGYTGNTRLQCVSIYSLSILCSVFPFLLTFLSLNLSDCLFALVCLSFYINLCFSWLFCSSDHFVCWIDCLFLSCYFSVCCLCFFPYILWYVSVFYLTHLHSALHNPIIYDCLFFFIFLFLSVLCPSFHSIKFFNIYHVCLCYVQCTT